MNPEDEKKESRVGPTLVGEEEIPCPACQAPMKITHHVYDMPHVGRVLLTSGRCSRCGYRVSDVMLLDGKGKRHVEFSVEKPEDLNKLVVKASSATLRIPELGLEMKPGPAAQGFITTVEGVLRRFLDVLDFLCRSGEADEDTCREKRRELEEALEGRKKFKLVIDDPLGGSAVIEW
ncbi:MAG: ZPR1 zinc finger domain-containing protein [Crenarchaeota archaeon]|nr:ZPR1 zinc finger domain-containing protein [Thermoproteota archaeon]